MVKNCKTNAFGSAVRDDMIQFQLDNEVASSLVASKIGDQLSVQLLSKTGGLLGTPVLLSLGEDSVSSATLDVSKKKLVLTCISGRKVECSVAGIFSEIDAKCAALESSKQDLLTAGDNIEIDSDNKISVKDLPAFPGAKGRYMLIASVDEEGNISYEWKKVKTVYFD